MKKTKLETRKSEDTGRGDHSYSDYLQSRAAIIL